MTNLEELEHIKLDAGYNLPEQEQSDSITKYILSNDDMVNKFIAAMLGRLYSADEGKYFMLDPNAVPVQIMNIRGITKYAGMLSQITDRGVLHSNLKKDEVCELAFQTLIDVLCDVFVNSESYDMDETEFDLFMAQIKVVIFTTLKRPQDAGERRAINTRGKVFEHIMRKEGTDPTKEPTSFYKLGRGK